jgi:uncharacterized protein YodC (DUF2158 family)
MSTENARAPSEGDLVKVQSGGPVMSVQEIHGEYALCLWFDENGKLQERSFLIASLKGVTSKSPG